MLLPIVAPLRLLAAAAAAQDERPKLSPGAWRQRLTDLVKLTPASP
jgi:hypothetical protein